MTLISEQDLYHELVTATPRRSDLDFGIDTVLVALGLDDPPPGVYWRQRQVAEPDGLLDLIRGEYPTASALLLVCGNLVRATELAGDHGYGQLLVSAGAVAHATPKGTVLADNHPALTRLVTRISDGSLRQLVTVALGGGA